MSQIVTKASSAVAAGTTGTGLATWLEWIPSDIGKLATLIGAVLSLVLIVYWSQRIFTEFHKGKIDRERDRLELAKLRNEIDELSKAKAP